MFNTTLKRLSVLCMMKRETPSPSTGSKIFHRTTMHFGLIRRVVRLPVKNSSTHAAGDRLAEHGGNGGATHPKIKGKDK